MKFPPKKIKKKENPLFTEINKLSTQISELSTMKKEIKSYKINKPQVLKSICWSVLSKPKLIWKKRNEPSTPREYRYPQQSRYKF